MIMTPVLCLITDRRRGVPQAGGDEVAARRDLVARVGAAARAGVHLIQVRERDLDGRALVELVRACLSAVRATSTRVLVNDRVDVALAAGAHGVHLRANSMPGGRARAVAPPGFLIGRSVHSVDDVRAVAVDAGADYVVFGTVWPTPSKPGRSPAGLTALAEAVRASSLPVLAVGGVTEIRVGDVARAGAAGVAAIGLFGETEASDAALAGVVRRLTHNWTSSDG